MRVKLQFNPACHRPIAGCETAAGTRYSDAGPATGARPLPQTTPIRLAGRHADTLPSYGSYSRDRCRTPLRHNASRTRPPTSVAARRSDAPRDRRLALPPPEVVRRRQG
ncbi:hypothetical protein Q4I32_000012 [Leishmania shawi]|uniref:Uncharacterized protein n=1 Tax=Leishmania shawi TaxID=5680 RepID=A0AAW3CA00_9TRYP